jgi:beta-galactosidase
MVGTQNIRAFYIVITLAALPLCVAAAEHPRDRLDMNGKWEFRLDPENTGLTEKWYASHDTFPSSIVVPGAWQAQGFGEPSGNLRHHYAGTAWYRRKISVPQSWRGKKLVLRVGGAHRRATLFVNGRELGGHDGFSAPFGFDVSTAIRPGAENDIVLRIENPPVRIEESPDKQEPKLPTGMLNYIGNWGGIYGDVSLECIPETRIDSVLITSKVEQRRVSFRIRVKGEGKIGDTSLRVEIPGAESVAHQVSLESGEAEFPLEVAVPNIRLWSPENPQLTTATIRLLENGREIDRLEQRFGFREIATRGKTLLLNGKPVYLRGYGDDNIEVLTGFPPSSWAVFIERLKLAKSFGFNAVRFHSMTPPPEYFEAADAVGMLVMAELPAAYTQYFFAHRDFLKREMASILLAYRNHPSLLSLAFGNEFNLKWLKTDADRSVLLNAIRDFYAAAKELAPATLIMSNDGFDIRPTDTVSLYRGSAADRPTKRHEFGQYYCSLPDVSLIDQFTGVINPEWLTAKKKWISANKLTETYPLYVRNSQRLQQLGRKYQIERVRVDASVTGYDYWLIVDYPGGTGEGDSWEEGWFDYFWHPKGITPPEGREINSPVLLMIDAGVDDRTLWAGDQKSVGVLVSNYGTDTIRNAQLSWELLDGTTRLDGSALSVASAPLGTVSKMGEIALPAPTLTSPKKLQLIIKLETPQGAYQNRWNFWAFPRNTPTSPAIPVVSTVRLAALKKAYPQIRTDTSALTPESLLITEVLDTAALSHLGAGGRVWLMLRTSAKGRPTEFFPASGGAFGTVVLDHAALSGFPHGDFCELQFYNMIEGAVPLSIDHWPTDVKPIIGAIRTTSEFLSKTKNLSRVAYIVEGKAARGKLLITSLRLRDNFDEAYPEAITLFDSLIRYASGSSFQPQSTVPDSVLENLGAE